MTAASIALALVIVFLLVLVLLLLVNRARSRVAAQPGTDVAEDASRVLEAQRGEIAERGDELLERRAEIDASRGMAGGDPRLDQALLELDQRRQSGAISSDEYEAEKVRLLGGL